MRENPLFSEKFYDTFIFAILESAEEFLTVVRTIVIERKKGSADLPWREYLSESLWFQGFLCAFTFTYETAELPSRHAKSVERDPPAELPAQDNRVLSGWRGRVLVLQGCRRRRRCAAASYLRRCAGRSRCNRHAAGRRRQHWGECPACRAQA